MVIVGVDGDTYTIVRGEFNFQDIQYELEDLGTLRRTATATSRLWKDGFGASVALLEGIGHVRMYGRP